eukprot:scaffold666526_cov90-Prasinocladus_malaysianus.AAC.1
MAIKYEYHVALAMSHATHMTPQRIRVRVQSCLWDTYILHTVASMSNSHPDQMIEGTVRMI